MKRWSVKHRILFLAMSPVVAISTLLTILVVIGGVAEMDGALKTRGMAMARQLAPASEYGVFSGNREILQALAQSVMKEDDIKAVIITDDRGKVLAVSGRPSWHANGMAVDWTVSEEKDSLIFAAPIHRNELEVDDYGLLADAPGSGAKKKALGRVYVELSTLSTVQRKNHFVAASMAIGFFGLIGAFLLALRMSGDLTGPLSRLLDAVGRMTQGNLDTRVAADSGGELEELENGFNHMAEKLQSAHTLMQQRIDEATELLSHQASHDVLTGLVNRREFENRLTRALARTHEHGLEHALCYMDLDQFKAVNDTCGHIAGDELLRQLSLLLRQRVRDRDTLARLGGDEFGLLLESCRLEDAMVIAEQFRVAVTGFRFAWQDKTFSIGISIGLAVIDRGNANLIEALSAADSACYTAKYGGRNRVHVYQNTVRM
ncbi:MAG: diguanylate cyclase [Sulfuricella sp.]|nr:diguanylate cyclase [Sulfuricella sp.]